MVTAFVIEAETGEYEDRLEWPVAVCLTVEASNRYMERIKNWFALQGLVAVSSGTGFRVAVDRDSEQREELIEAFGKQFREAIQILSNCIYFKRLPVQLVES